MNFKIPLEKGKNKRDGIEENFSKTKGDVLEGTVERKPDKQES